jgi:hypothetical protein
MSESPPTKAGLGTARTASHVQVASRRGHIRRDQARRVASAFLDAPRFAPAARTLAAYAELSEQSSRWYHRLTSGRDHPPFRVVFTHCREPYATASELSESVRRDGLLELWPASRDHDRRHPLLDTAAGGAYDRLRAVHDIVSHGWLGHEFDADGEFSAWLTEDRLYAGLARWALATELHGEHSVLWTSGTIADHKAVLLDRALLRASRTRDDGPTTPGTDHSSTPTTGADHHAHRRDRRDRTHRDQARAPAPEPRS